MKVSGIQLKEAIKMAGLELDIVRSQFNDSLHKFKDETKPHPANVASRIESLEEKLGLLQTAQRYFNLNVTGTFLGREITLENAVKIVGGKGRVAKMWRQAARGAEVDKWDRRQALTRKADEEKAEPTITQDEALQKAKETERKASDLRALIAKANAQEIEIEWLDESLMSL